MTLESHWDNGAALRRAPVTLPGCDYRRIKSESQEHCCGTGLRRLVGESRKLKLENRVPPRRSPRFLCELRALCALGVGYCSLLDHEIFLNALRSRGREGRGRKSRSAGSKRAYPHSMPEGQKGRSEYSLWNEECQRCAREFWS